MKARYIEPKKLWEVDWGQDSRGKKQRAYFKTEDEANKALSDFKKEVKRCGEYWARLDDDQRTEAVLFLTKCRDASVTPLHVWNEWQRLLKAQPDVSKITPTAYEKAITEWRTRKLGAGKSERYCDEVVDLFEKFGEGRMQMNIHEISADTLEKWIHGQKTWGNSSKQTNQLRFSSLWTVAVDKKWCTENIVDRMEPIARDAPTRKIFPNSDVRNILAGMIEFPETRESLLPVVLGYFCCMRPEEVSEPPEDPKIPAFNWDDIDIQHRRITVRAGVDKNGEGRTIRLQPVAVKWLQYCKDAGCPLPPVNERRDVDAMCELINLKEWLRDGLRKNCATHLRNVYRNDYDVVLDMGHKIRVLLKHYAALHITQEESDEYWAISPEAVEKYRQTDEWKALLVEAAKAKAIRDEAKAKEEAEAKAAEEAKSNKPVK